MFRVLFRANQGKKLEGIHGFSEHLKLILSNLPYHRFLLAVLFLEECGVSQNIFERCIVKMVEHNIIKRGDEYALT